MRKTGATKDDEEMYQATAGADREYLKNGTRDLSKADEAREMRPPIPVLHEDQDEIKFMQIDVDYYTERHSNLPNYLKKQNN